MSDQIHESIIQIVGIISGVALSLKGALVVFTEFFKGIPNICKAFKAMINYFKGGKNVSKDNPKTPDRTPPNPPPD